MSTVNGVPDVDKFHEGLQAKGLNPNRFTVSVGGNHIVVRKWSGLCRPYLRETWGH